MSKRKRQPNARDQLVDALHCRDASRIEYIAMNDPSLLNKKIFFNDCPLHFLLRTHALDPNECVLAILQMNPQAAKMSTTYHEMSDQDIRAHKSSREAQQLLANGNPGGLLPMHLAAKNSAVTLRVLGRLVGAFPEALMARDGKGRCPLHYALMYRSLAPFRNFKFLLESCSMAAQVRDQDGYLPIDYAMKFKHDKQAQLLRKVYPQARTIQDNEGRTHLHKILSQEDGEDLTLDQFESIAEKSVPSVFQLVDKNGHLPIHCAAMSRHLTLETLKALVARYPEGLQIPDINGNLPLHLAATHYEDGNSIGEIVDVNPPRPSHVHFLAKAHPQAVEIRNSAGNLPLHLAVRAHDPKQSNVMLMSVMFPQGLTSRDGEGYIPLHLAIQHVGRDSRSMLKLLIARSPESIRIPDREGRLPIHLAVRRGDPLNEDDREFSGELLHDDDVPVASLLIESYPEGLLVPDLHRNLPLHYALTRVTPYQELDRAVLSVLIEKASASLRYVLADSWQLPIHIASSKCAKYPEALEELINIYPDCLAIQDRKGQTPLHVLIKAGSDGSLLPYDPSEEQKREIDESLKKAINLYVSKWPSALGMRDSNGQLPLHVAAAHAAPFWLVDLLMKANAPAAFTSDNACNLPWMLACKSDASLDVVYSLIRADPTKLVAPP